MNIRSNLLARLHIEHIAPKRRALAAAWSWWTAELLQMLPADIRQNLAPAGRSIYLVPGTKEWTVFRRTDGRLAEVSRHAIDVEAGSQIAKSSLAGIDGAVVLLPAGKSLVKRITLPAATEENLRGVLEFQMDRETPFTADRVYFDARVAARSSEDKTIDVDLVLTPRAYLDALAGQLALRGIKASAVTARNRDGEIIDANLLPTDSRPPRAPLVNRLNLRLATVAGLLLIAAIALPIVNKVSVIAQLTPRVEAARAAARDGSRIRDNIESLHNAAQSLVDRKSTDPMILELLDATTEVVPDTTWITEFEVDGRSVRINGESEMAASLIELFDQAESFVNPQFSAPVTRVRNSDRERHERRNDAAGTPPYHRRIDTVRRDGRSPEHHCRPHLARQPQPRHAHRGARRFARSLREHCRAGFRDPGLLHATHRGALIERSTSEE